MVATWIAYSDRSSPGDIMPSLSFNLHPRLYRNRILASAAAVALVASGAIGGAVMSYSAPARAAAVATSDLQTQSMPSFATVVERVKPAVVSVKVKIENAARPLRQICPSQMDNLPPQIQQFFKRFGDQNGAAPRALRADDDGARDPASSSPPTAMSSPTIMSSRTPRPLRSPWTTARRWTPR